MRAKVTAVLLTAVLGSSLALAVNHAIAADGPNSCRGRQLAIDPLGDDAYAGQTGTGLESSSGDIEWVRSSLGAGGPKAKTATFTVKVRDLTATSPQHFDLRATLDVVTDRGETIVVDARRSSVTGASGTFAGDSTGVAAQFLEDRDIIVVTGPFTAFAGARAVSLSTGEIRYDSGASLSPLADSVSGSCVMRIDPTYAPQPAEDLGGLPAKVLVIDSGVNGAHPEFANLFGWWDFSSTSADANPFDNSAGSGTWQDRDGDGNLAGDVDDPYDPDGHGSASSSMAAGLNLASTKTPSSCPGCPLAVAKVMNDTDAALDGAIEDAIVWGVDELGVDVINISIGLRAPLPADVLAGAYDAFAYARDHGVLVVVANGNGWGNAGGPGQPGGLMGYGNSPDVLSVGADDDLYRYLVTTDPEVVATFAVHAAGPKGGEYQDISGTSFSSPLTAGVAANLIGSARACGSSYDLGPASIEQLIKYTANDRPDTPPTFEGYGVVDRDTLATARGVVCDGDELPTPDGTTDLYVTTVAGSQRDISSARLGQETTMSMTDVTDVTGALVLGASAPAGAFDAEVYRTTVAPGAFVTVVALGQGPTADVNDFDMALYPGVGPDFASADRLASSGEAGAVKERLTWTNDTGAPQVVSLVVYGFAIAGEQAFTLHGISRASRVFDGYLTGNNVL